MNNEESPNKLKLFNLALTLSFDCPNGCRHCGVADIGKEIGEMGVEKAKRYIDMSSQLEQMMSISITGGEPLLYFDKVNSILKYGQSKYNYAGNISTSAYGMDTLTETKSLLAKLQKAGLRSLLLSVGDFHQEYVPIENVKHCLKAAEYHDIPVIVQTAGTKSSNKSEDYKKILDTKGGKYVTFLDIPCDPIGRAKEEIPDEEFSAGKHIPKGNCSMFQVVQIWPNGSVKLCCGTASRHENLTFGNVNGQHLFDIVKKAETSPLPNALSSWRGPGYLIELAKTGGYSERLLDGYTSECHACHHLISDPELYSYLEEKLEAQTQKIVGARLFLEEKYNYFQPHL